MDRIELQVANRETLGKKVKHLRRQGITPVHLFGHGIESLALQCSTGELERVLAQGGHTGLINLNLDKEKKPRTVVVRKFNRDWRKGQLLHVDFYEVQMGEKIKLEVPVITIGEAPALKAKDNMLDHELDALSVECLPAKIPTSIEVDISSLTQSGQAIRVKDVALGEGITILNDPELVLVKISKRAVAEVEEEAVEEAAEVAEEAIEGPDEAGHDKEKSREA